MLKIRVDTLATDGRGAGVTEDQRKWLCLGDKNIKFFHSACRIRQYGNQIKQRVNSERALVQDEASIKALAPEFYQTLFNQNNYTNAFPKLVVKKILTHEAQ